MSTLSRRRSSFRPQLLATLLVVGGLAGNLGSLLNNAFLLFLIVCFILYQTAATEVKGFALTLSIGVLATIFTSLFVSRVVFALFTDVFGIRNIPMLPTVVPAM